MQKKTIQMMNFKDFIKNIFFFLLPLLYIIYIIYIRLILVRDARILYIPLSFTQIVFTLIIIAFLVLRIYFLLKKERIIKENETKNRFLLWIKTKLSAVSKYINEIWIEFYHKFTRYSLKLNFLILDLVKLMYKRLNLVNGLIIISVFEIIPKLILVTAFLIDVFIYQQFYYFYKFVFLLLLPLIFVTLRGILLQFYLDNYEELRSCLKIEVDAQQTELSYSFKDDFERVDGIKDIDDFMVNHYLPVSYIPNLVVHFDSIKIQYKLNWLLIVILLLHLLGWLTILFFGIYV